MEKGSEHSHQPIFSDSFRRQFMNGMITLANVTCGSSAPLIPKSSAELMKEAEKEAVKTEKEAREMADNLDFALLQDEGELATQALWDRLES